MREGFGDEDTQVFKPIRLKGTGEWGILVAIGFIIFLLLCFYFYPLILTFCIRLAGHQLEDSHLCWPPQPESGWHPPVLTPYAPGHSPPSQHLPQLHVWTPWKPHLPQEPSAPNHPVPCQALFLWPTLHELPLFGPAGGRTAAGVNPVREKAKETLMEKKDGGKERRKTINP